MSLVYKIKPSLLLSTLAFLSKMLLPSLVHTFSHFLPVFVPFMVKQMMLDINNMPQGYNGDSSAKTSCHNILATVYIECGWQDKSVSKAMEATGEAYMAQKIAETTNNRFCTGKSRGSVKHEPSVIHFDCQESSPIYPSLKGEKRVNLHLMH